MFKASGMSGVNRDMKREAPDNILRLWASPEPFEYNGKNWQVNLPARSCQLLRPRPKSLQQPNPPIAVAGRSKGAGTLKLAGECGFIPMSLSLNLAYVANHRSTAGTDRPTRAIQPP